MSSVWCAACGVRQPTTAPHSVGPSLSLCVADAAGALAAAAELDEHQRTQSDDDFIDDRAEEELSEA